MPVLDLIFKSLVKSEGGKMNGVCDCTEMGQVPLLLQCTHIPLPQHAATGSQAVLLLSDSYSDNKCQEMRWFITNLTKLTNCCSSCTDC